MPSLGAVSVTRNAGWYSSDVVPSRILGWKAAAKRTANSVVELGRDGELVWSFQNVHHDVGDYDLPAQPTWRA